MTTAINGALGSSRHTPRGASGHRSSRAADCGYGLLFLFGHTETQWDRAGREHTWTMVNEVWADWGGLSLLQQLGLTPQEQSAQTSR